MDERYMNLTAEELFERAAERRIVLGDGLCKRLRRMSNNGVKFMLDREGSIFNMNGLLLRHFEEA